MTRLKKFLDKRAKGIAKEKAKKEGIEFDDSPKMIIKTTEINSNVGFKVIEKEVPLKEEDVNLSDEEFWDISNTFNHQVRKSNEPIEIILQRILENYTPLKIQQFAKRFEELNK